MCERADCSSNASFSVCLRLMAELRMGLGLDADGADTSARALFLARQQVRTLAAEGRLTQPARTYRDLRRMIAAADRARGAEARPDNG